MDTDTLANELSKIQAGFLPANIFNQIARLGVLTYIELLAFRNLNEKTEVLLTKREASDPFWPNMYHNPGTVLRPDDTDFSFNSALERLLNDEYDQDIKDDPYFAGFWFEQLERGKGLGIVSFIELKECAKGEYFNINKLPSNLIKGQGTYIKNAAKIYNNYKCGKFNPTPLSKLILQ